MTVRIFLLVAQWMGQQLAELKDAGSSPAGEARVPVAKWIRLLTTNQAIVGSTPTGYATGVYASVAQWKRALASEAGCAGSSPARGTYFWDVVQRQDI